MKRPFSTLLALLRSSAPPADPEPPSDPVADLKRAAEAAIVEGLNRGVLGKPDWTVAEIEICCESGIEPITGMVKGGLAVHPVGCLYSLTHLPTGLAIASHFSVIRLFVLAERLLPLSCWGTALARGQISTSIRAAVSAEIKRWRDEERT